MPVCPSTQCDHVITILQVDFDPFLIRHSQQWKSVMDRFNREVVAIENEAKMFIDESFQSLRSAEGAFDMLLKFKHIRSREAINAQMMQKFRDILVQYQKEVDTIDNLFRTQHDNPPLHKNHPPVAGSIFWERSLFHRIKHVIIRFQAMEDMMTSDMGKGVSTKIAHDNVLIKVIIGASFVIMKTYLQYIILTPLKPLLYGKSGVKRGIHCFSYYCLKTQIVCTR